MFDLLTMLLSSIASFLFPIFASYKALKSSDPAQLTPWLMYWVVFSCVIFVESWFYWVLFWTPFYGYVRLFFFLYLVLPQTQGARTIYEDYIHPFLENNEAQIDNLIASAHDRLKAAGLAYLRQAIDYVKTNVLGLPPPESSSPTPESAVPQSYTQSLRKAPVALLLLCRTSLPRSTLTAVWTSRQSHCMPGTQSTTPSVLLPLSCVSVSPRRPP
jgi:receptor expression-enhancing protein 1/2/3/4